MDKIRLGVFGLGRGRSLFSSMLAAGAQIVAVCEKDERRIEEALKISPDVAVYRDFEEFIEHPMDAVMLCNYFNEHAEYAVRCLERNIHVLSETASNTTMADGVKLVRAAEKSKAFYMLAENYPFMVFNQEMRRVYREGTLGHVLFAEGEYNHPLNPGNMAEVVKLRPSPEHWRNNIPRTYYITHSLAPLMYITGQRPVRVSAMPVYGYEEDVATCLNVHDRAAIITTLNDDKSVFRITGCASFGCHENSYRICGERGQIENVRGSGNKVMLNYDKWNVPEGREEHNYYKPEFPEEDKPLLEKAGHGGSDFYVFREFISCIRENRRPEFDEYFGTTMASVGILAHRSILEGNKPFDIPDFRKEADRVLYENDSLTPFYGKNGEEPTLPCCSDPNYVPSPNKLAVYENALNERKV
jgi:predicted dehydrogenase